MEGLLVRAQRRSPRAGTLRGGAEGRGLGACDRTRAWNLRDANARFGAVDPDQQPRGSSDREIFCLRA